MRKYLAEFISTFFLVFVGAGSMIADIQLANFRVTDSFGLTGVALAHGLALAVAIAATAHISGGHVNPAVSLAFWIARRISLTDMLGYVLAQLLGGLVAAFLLRGFLPAELFRFAGGGVPSLQVPVLSGIGIEAILTFFLVFTIWGTAVDKRGPNLLAPLAIGLALTFGIFAGGAFTGAAVNPARWLGPAIASGEFSNAVVWIAGPILGALLGSVLYETFLMGDQPPPDAGVMTPEEEEDYEVEAGDVVRPPEPRAEPRPEPRAEPRPEPRPFGEPRPGHPPEAPITPPPPESSGGETEQDRP